MLRLEISGRRVERELVTLRPDILGRGNADSPPVAWEADGIADDGGPVFATLAALAWPGLTVVT